MNLLAPAVAFVDLETTGTSATGDRVTEVAIVRVVEGELVEEWSSLVDPERSIPPDIQVLTGITNEMVKGAPTFADIRHEVLGRLADGIAGDAAAGFVDHEGAGGGVPGFEVFFKEAVQAAAGDVAQVQGSGTAPAQPLDYSQQAP